MYHILNQKHLNPDLIACHSVAPTELGTLKSRFNDFGLVAVGLWVGWTGLAWWGVAPTEPGTGLGTLKSRFNEFGLVAVG